MRHQSKYYVLGTFLVLCCGCASYPVNPPLQRVDENLGYRMSNRTLGEKNSDELFVIVSLSGGGTRAIALDYGVLKYLDQIQFGPDNRSLLDEVDLISSSSSSSIPAAYYGLFGQATFLDDFAEDILYQEIETALKKRLMNPLQWPRLASGRFSRGDLLVEYFNRQMFDGHRFEDMQQQRPFIMLNATDMGISSQFSFTQGYFDLICSDLSQVTVARAVTASLAFIPGFTPLTLKNYNDGHCGDTPAWVQDALSAGVDENPSVHAAARDVLSYQDIDKRPYIHLLDSGISDNIAIRAPHLALRVTGQIDRVIDGTIKKLVIIMVDAKSETYFKGDLKARPPGVISSTYAIATRPLDTYSYETTNFIKRDVRDARNAMDQQQRIKNTCHDHARSLCEQVEMGAGCYETVSSSCLSNFGVSDADPPLDFDIYLVHVSFDSIEDPTRRERFQTIPTTLELPPEQIDSLIEVAPELLREDPEFSLLLKDLGAHISD